MMSNEDSSYNINTTPLENAENSNGRCYCNRDLTCRAEIGNLKKQTNIIGARPSQTGQIPGFGNTQVTSVMTSTPCHVVTVPIKEHNANEGQPR